MERLVGPLIIKFFKTFYMKKLIEKTLRSPKLRLNPVSGPNSKMMTPWDN